ncbi:hypothetical protein HD554DRAFT_726910 [Boletus coccyginus]|nr:hypothetical protein HD554DRAFT_726910 [Boletus coccyginus]
MKAVVMVRFHNLLDICSSTRAVSDAITDSQKKTSPKQCPCANRDPKVVQSLENLLTMSTLYTGNRFPEEQVNYGILMTVFAANAIMHISAPAGWMNAAATRTAVLYCIKQRHSTRCAQRLPQSP